MKMKIKVIIPEENVKCRSCNWETNKLFGLEVWTKAEMLCGECFSNYLYNKDYSVEPNEEILKETYLP